MRLQERQTFCSNALVFLSSSRLQLKSSVCGLWSKGKIVNSCGKNIWPCLISDVSEQLGGDCGKAVSLDTFEQIIQYSTNGRFMTQILLAMCSDLILGLSLSLS